MGWGIVGDVFDAVGDAVEEGAEWVAGAAEDAAGAVVDAAGDVADAVGDAAEAVGGAIEDAAQAIAEAAEDAVDALESAAEDALEALEQGAAAVADMADDAWDHVTDVAEDAWDAVAGAVEDAWEVVSDTVEASWDALVAAVEDAWEAVEGAASDAWDWAVGTAEAAWDRATEIVEAGIDELSKAYEWAVEAMALAIEWLGGVFVEIGQLFLQLGACIAGQVVYRVAKAGNIIANIYKPPKLLSADFQSDMVRVFGGSTLSKVVNTSDFALVVYVDDALLSANWFSDGTDAMTFGMTSIGGVTVGGLIYTDKPWRETVDDDRVLMAHELVHTTQYRRFINESGFACAYGIGFAQADFDYASNPLEAQAFTFTDANETAITA
jgi:hypothetical protein